MTTTKVKLSAPDRLDFALFCENATLAQLPNIITKERDAKRWEYHGIAVAELMRREREGKVLHWLDDPRGIYTPRDFALSFGEDFRQHHIKGISPEDWLILMHGPGGMLDDDDGDIAERYKKAFPNDKDPHARNERYWDTWSEVCDNAKLYLDRPNRPDSKHYWRIHQDGSCWLVRNDVEWCHECDGWKDKDCGCPHTNTDEAD
jgi:hypothetical protein